MAKSIISEGKTSTEAIENGLKQLKVSKDLIDEQYERDIQNELDKPDSDEIEEFVPEIGGENDG